MRAINSLGRALNSCGLPPLRLSAVALMAAAQRRTGLSDWGDASFREAFRRLLEAYERTAQLHLLGRLALRQECLRLLSNRLRIQEDLKRFPLIEQTPIKKPLVIVGLPRTGTTLLHHLLAQDPSARVPRLWELLQPSPPPCPGTLATEPRLKQAEQLIRRAITLAPHFQALHPLSATGPEECLFLFQHAFMSVVFEAYGEVPAISPGCYTKISRRSIGIISNNYKCCSGVGRATIGSSSRRIISSFWTCCSRSFPMRAWCRPIVILPRP